MMSTFIPTAAEAKCAKASCQHFVPCIGLADSSSKAETKGLSDSVIDHPKTPKLGIGIALSLAPEFFDDVDHCQKMNALSNSAITFAPFKNSLFIVTIFFGVL